MLKLPRQLENDPRREAIERVLAQDVRPLWAEGTVGVPRVAFTPALESALRFALTAKAVERGLENIEQVLDREEKGLAAAREKQGTAAAQRTSRLLVLANDGAERFYRQAEAILRRHGDRVLGLAVDAPSGRLSEKLYGADKLVKVVLVSDRDAVVRVLGALAG